MELQELTLQEMEEVNGGCKNNCCKDDCCNSIDIEVKLSIEICL
jgi:hypothetical protein